MWSLFHGRSRSRVTERLEFAFAGRAVEVRYQPYRRTVGLTLRINGRIHVTAPHKMTRDHIISFLLTHSDWIETHSRRYEALRAAYPRKSYRAGEKFLFLGHQLQMRVESVPSAKFRVRVEPGFLVIGVPEKEFSRFTPEHEHPELEKLVNGFYREQGSRFLRERLEHFSQKMSLAPTSVSFRSQKTRWGSCSSKGKISLNWRLIVAPIEVLDYVVVHELSHLKHYNHSKDFWNLVGTQIPDYRARREWLKSHQYEADFLASRSELHADG